MSKPTMDPAVRIIFRYDETSGKWEIFVRNAKDEIEGKQAFNAVLLTCQDVVVGMEHQTRYHNENTIEIIPAVTVAGLMRSGVKQ